jgi:nucleotide-binding universal stress UspA family protein
MSFFKNILCPINFDDAAPMEIENARAAATFFDAKLYLLHVATILSLPQEVRSKGGQGWTAQQAAEKLAEIARDSLGELQYEALSSDAPTGYVAEPIVAAAGRVGADLIILATHGHRGLARLMLGNVAGQVVHKAQCPVLTVRLGRRNFAKPKRILCPISLADDSAATLNLATEVAGTSGATVKLVHVVEHTAVHASATSVGSKVAAEEAKKLQSSTTAAQFAATSISVSHRRRSSSIPARRPYKSSTVCRSRTLALPLITNSPRVTRSYSAETPLCVVFVLRSQYGQGVWMIPGSAETFFYTFA